MSHAATTARTISLGCPSLSLGWPSLGRREARLLVWRELTTLLGVVVALVLAVVL